MFFFVVFFFIPDVELHLTLRTHSDFFSLEIYGDNCPEISNPVFWENKSITSLSSAENFTREW